MFLKKLEIRNMRKVKQADIEFHGPGLQVIQGMNKSGKTTIAQSIAITLDGPNSFVPGMITQGEEQAEICAYTDDGLQIRTIIKDSVKQTVSRMDPTANRYVAVSGGVRKFLNSIRSGLEMPWTLRDLTDAKIIEILKDRAGISQKIDDIDAEIKTKETVRTDVGRDKKKIGTLDPLELVKHPDPIDGIRAEHDRATAYLKKLRETLVKAENYLKEQCSFKDIEGIIALKDNVDLAIKAAKKHMGDDTPYTAADLEKLDAQLSEWVESERKAIAYDTYIQKKQELDNLTADYEKLTQEIEGLRENRKSALAEMNPGVKGLEIGEDNMLYHNGVLRGITETNAVGNWSTAESVQVFFSIGARYSGAIRILVVDNAESLDSETTESISKWAEKAGFLVILLKVSDVPENLEEGIIYVKEGEVIKK